MVKLQRSQAFQNGTGPFIADFWLPSHRHTEYTACTFPRHLGRTSIHDKVVLLWSL